MEIYPIDQAMVAAAPCITFGEVRDLAKAKGVNLKEHFRNVIPADVLDRVAMPKYAKVVMPYWPVIAWYQGATTHPCRCGCMARVDEGQRFHCSTCRVRYEIMRERKPGVQRRPRKKTA
jgi:hypothetical protein